MRGMTKFLLILNLLFFGNLYPQATRDTASVATASQSVVLREIDFDAEEIETYKTEKEFDYLNRIEEDSWWTRFKRWLQLKYSSFMNWLFGEYEPSGFWLFVLKILPYLLLFGLVALIFWLFIRLNPANAVMEEPMKARVNLQKEEELVQSADISALIKEAIVNEDYRLAVRYLYLKSLRKLDQNEFISYKFQKTNKDYINEIKQPKVNDQFTRITRLYDFIWYGAFQLSKERFETARAEFIKMENSINSNQND
ncbi:protein of unknown function [Salegentibacter echinorum]|uniref:Protein-glutamine gamma-glutamyltransferase-like C-terminal domain-containing protein n=2 Tax=Salegentibacter echinorum TaxID=1073325 RepID=A0A1M5CPQ6_SALEC|nr:protein of unknown function [Salegentibacter echinorum]